MRRRRPVSRLLRARNSEDLGRLAADTFSTLSLAWYIGLGAETLKACCGHVKRTPTRQESTPAWLSASRMRDLTLETSW